MRANLFLADSAQVADGKLMVLGGGVKVLSAPVAIAGFIVVGWDETNIKHKLQILLVDAAGNKPSPASVEIEAVFEYGRPPNIPAGSDFLMPIAMALGVLPVGPGIYEFRVVLDGEGDPQWNLPFVVPEIPSPR